VSLLSLVSHNYIFIQSAVSFRLPAAAMPQAGWHPSKTAHEIQRSYDSRHGSTVADRGTTSRRWDSLMRVA
jgi:hypothetical protein